LGKILTEFESVGKRFSKEVSSFQVIAYFEKLKLLAPYKLSHKVFWCIRILRCVMHNLKNSDGLNELGAFFCKVW